MNDLKPGESGKCSYITLDARWSAAYLDHKIGPDATGVDKHSGEPVTLHWDQRFWREVST